VRTIDLDAVASGDESKAIVSTVAVPLANWGLVVRNGDAAGKHRAFVSGGDSGKVWVFDVDDTSGALTQDESKTIDLGTITGTDGKPAPFFSAGIAVTPDGKTLVSTSVLSRDLRILSLDAATYGKELARVDLGGSDHYTVAMDPNDTTGEVAYVSMWANAQIASIDLSTGTIKKTIPVGKDPEQMAFLDARWMVVAAGTATC